MAEQPTSDELFARLDALKTEIEAIRNEADRFRKVAQVLENPLRGGLGRFNPGYAEVTADPNLPNTEQLGERLRNVQGEHFDLLTNQARNLKGTLKDTFLKELHTLKGD